MVVMILEKVPPSVRGDLTRWLLEVRKGVYVGHVSAMVRNLLWEGCCKKGKAGRVFQAWSTNNEQHFMMRAAGCDDMEVVNWEGLLLIQEKKEDLTTVQKKRLRAQ